MGVYISELDIETYRGIKKLKMENLAPINIITGDNNSGKTSVLELLQSVKNPTSFRVWRNLIRNNGMNLSRGLTYYDGFYDLFDVNEDTKKIEYAVSLNGEKHVIEMQATVLHEEILESQFNKLQGLSYVRYEDDYAENIMNVSKLQMQIKDNGQIASNSAVYEGQIRYVRNKSNEDSSREKNIIYISPTRHAEGTLYLNAVLETPDLYEQMLAILKDYDEDIMSINYDNSEENGRRRGVYKILSKSHKKALPLNVYGDGMKKAVLLMSAVIAAEDGVLLIDEFETAIHTSAMKNTFRWILETCRKLNVQVFVTSHSKEAIDKLLKCSEKCLDDMALYTLYKKENMTAVRRMNGRKAIEAQDNMGLELR